MSTLGSRIRELRIRRGLTQQQMADKLGMTLSNFNKYERDRGIPPSTILSKIADILGTKTDYLLGREEEVMNFEELKDSEKDLIILTRQKNMEQIPNEERKKLYEFFSQTIDVYLAKQQKK